MVFAAFPKIHENIQLDRIGDIFNNVSFIAFNYDRYIEHYLYQALQNYFGVPASDTAQLMEKLVILHPYGVVGALPWQNTQTNVSFGGGLRNRADIIDIANQIRTFTERLEDDSALLAIRRQVQEAEVIVFLGFGYHALNMQLLSPDTTSNVKLAFGTAYDISDLDVKQAIIPGISHMLKTGIHRATYVHNRLRCCELFREHSYTLSL